MKQKTTADLKNHQQWFLLKQVFQGVYKIMLPSQLHYIWDICNN